MYARAFLKELLYNYILPLLPRQVKESTGPKAAGAVLRGNG
jgi:hypothetical protein